MGLGSVVRMDNMDVLWEHGWLGAASMAEGDVGAIGHSRAWEMGKAKLNPLSLGEAGPFPTLPTGHLQECRRDPCCTIGCKLRRGVQCLTGPCCQKCRVSRVMGWECCIPMG